MQVDPLQQMQTSLPALQSKDAKFFFNRDGFYEKYGQHLQAQSRIYPQNADFSQYGVAVYASKHEQQSFCIKLVNMNSADELLPHQMQRELELCSCVLHFIYSFRQINHPYIADYFAGYIAEQQKSIVIFMESLNNLDLEMNLLAKCNALIHVCKAIMYLHSKDIAHRDIKAANVMVHFLY